jgi:transposase
VARFSTLSLGLDVHKESIAVAYVAQEHHAAVVALGNSGTRQCDLAQLIRQMPSKSTQLIFVYEAGPCGYGLSRSLTHKGQVCWVVAPSLIPTQPGARVTTNRRAALTLARLRRSGDLPPVDVPQVEEEAMRDLCRAREETIRVLQAATCQRQAFLLRHARRSPGRATWSPAPLRWLSAVVCPTPAQQSVFHADVRAVTDPTARLARLAPALTDQGQTWRLAPVVAALQALRGVPCTVAVTTVAARGDLTRFDHPRPLMHSLGVTPSADSTGERRPQGGLTTTGKSQARRALVAGAWASRDPAKSRRQLQLRLAKGPKPIPASSWQAPIRLGQRYRP